MKSEGDLDCDPELQRFLRKAEANSFELSRFSAMLSNSALQQIAKIWKAESQSSAGDDRKEHSFPLPIPALPFCIGSLRVEHKIGEGGFGKVFLATDTAAGKQVAVKILFRNQDAAKSHFLREAYLLSQLRHPSIVTCNEFGVFEGHPYYTMDYVEGISLAELIRNAKRDGVPEDFESFITSVAIEIADALGHVHARGLIHRDLKPNNILIQKDGRALLSDFGLATRDEGIEGSQTQGGTFLYMAPEQVRGEVTDSRADLFSFGATFYEAFTLEKAFHGKGPQEIRVSILAQTPEPAGRLNPQLPKSIEQILGKCLEKESVKRFQSADELLRALQTSWSKSEKNPETSELTTQNGPSKNPLSWSKISAISAACAVTLAGTFFLATSSAKTHENAQSPAPATAASQSVAPAKESVEPAAHVETDFLTSPAPPATLAKLVEERNEEPVQRATASAPIALTNVVPAAKPQVTAVELPGISKIADPKCFASANFIKFGDDYFLFLSLCHPALELPCSNRYVYVNGEQSGVKTLIGGIPFWISPQSGLVPLSYEQEKRLERDMNEACAKGKKLEDFQLGQFGSVNPEDRHEFKQSPIYKISGRLGGPYPILVLDRKRVEAKKSPLRILESELQRSIQNSLDAQTGLYVLKDGQLLSLYHYLKSAKI